MASIEDIIQQRTFESPAQRVLINLIYSGGWAKAQSLVTLKPFGLTWQQFNLMRILRGQRDRPATLRLIAERMLDPQSNASRLVDRLEGKKLVERVPCTDDRRQVRISLTEAGRDLLERASAAVKADHQRLGGDLSDEEMLHLSDLLDRFRMSNGAATGKTADGSASAKA